MDLQNIQEQLNTEFAKQETRIVFWFDDKAEYEAEVTELELGSVKLHILDGINWLYSKWLLNEEEPERSSFYLKLYQTERELVRSRCRRGRRHKITRSF